MSTCNCTGSLPGEPFCPCIMKAKGLYDSEGGTKEVNFMSDDYWREKKMEKSNLEIIQEELEKYQDTLVIDGSHEIVILRDYHVGDDDYYYVFEKFRGEIVHSSCVCGFISLKDQLRPADYNRTMDLFQMNHFSRYQPSFPKIEEEIKKPIPQIEKQACKTCEGCKHLRQYLGNESTTFHCEKLNGMIITNTEDAVYPEACNLYELDIPICGWSD